MSRRQLDGQLSMAFAEYGDCPYPSPCPARDGCGAYLLDGGGCNGAHGWCMTAQIAAGRTVPAWRVRLMSDYERNARGL